MHETSDDPHDPRRPDPESRAEPPPAWGEWVVAAFGLVLVLASLGYLANDALWVEQTPPAPIVEVLQVVPQQGGRFHARVRVRNGGRATAVGLKIVGELRRGGEVVESGELDLDYLPGESWREGGMYFSRDPRGLELRFWARGYQAP